jgi:hypothetical protein
MKKLNSLLFNQGGKCFYCDATLDIDEATLDHVIPQSKGGSNNLDNLVVCCKYANHAFRDYSPKQKMTVIKQLSGSSLLCHKIFPRKDIDEAIEPNEFEDIYEPDTQFDNDEVNLPVKPKKKVKREIQPKNLKEAYQLLCQAIDALEREGKQVGNSMVKKKMQKLNPVFNELDYGFSQFKKFLIQAQKDKIVILEAKKGGNYLIQKV